LSLAMAMRSSTGNFCRNVVLSLQNQRRHPLSKHFCRARILCSKQKDFTTSSSTLLSFSQKQVLIENLFDATNSSTDCAAMVTKITLNRPKANAMGREMIQELQNCLDVLEGGSDASSMDDTDETKQDKYNPHSIGGCRCLVVTSFSERVFSAGADLKERATMTQDETSEFVTVLRNTMERFASLPMPFIAAIEGVAVGGGLELALAADIRIASAKATMGLPETSLAIIPGAGGTQRLPRLIGASRAKELIWTGRKIDGTEALEYGLVTEVVSEGSCPTKYAMDLAFRIASNGPVAIRSSKAAINAGSTLTCMKEALEIERRCYEEVVPTEDRLEGLQAFKEGRKPSYTGK